MKFFYILNNQKKMITGGKINSSKAFLLESLGVIKFNDAKYIPLKLHSINLNKSIIESGVDDLLLDRDSKPLDIPSYDKNFWREEDIFEWKRYKGKELKLCNTGFDSNIIFLINLYNSILKNKSRHYIFLADNHKQFEDILNNTN